MIYYGLDNIMRNKNENRNKKPNLFTRNTNNYFTMIIYDDYSRGYREYIK